MMENPEILLEKRKKSEVQYGSDRSSETKRGLEQEYDARGQTSCVALESTTTQQRITEKIGKRKTPEERNEVGNQGTACLNTPTAPSPTTTTIEEGQELRGKSGFAVHEETIHFERDTTELNFPGKLMSLLNWSSKHTQREGITERQDDADGAVSGYVLGTKEAVPTIRWLSNGKGFEIVCIHTFTLDLLPKFFGQSTYSSFTRRLYWWGFKKMNPRASYGGGDIFFHECFLRDDPEKCAHFSRRLRKSKEERAQHKKNRCPRPSKKNKTRHTDSQSTLADRDESPGTDESNLETIPPKMGRDMGHGIGRGEKALIGGDDSVSNAQCSQYQQSKGEQPDNLAVPNSSNTSPSCTVAGPPGTANGFVTASWTDDRNSSGLMTHSCPSSELLLFSRWWQQRQGFLEEQENQHKEQLRQLQTATVDILVMREAIARRRADAELLRHQETQYHMALATAASSFAGAAPRPIAVANNRQPTPQHGLDTKTTQGQESVRQRGEQEPLPPCPCPVPYSSVSCSASTKFSNL